MLVLPLLIWPLTPRSCRLFWSTVATTASKRSPRPFSQFILHGTARVAFPNWKPAHVTSFQHVFKLLNRVYKPLYKSVPIYLSCLFLYCCCCSVAKSCPSLCDAMDCSILFLRLYDSAWPLPVLHIHHVSFRYQVFAHAVPSARNAPPSLYLTPASRLMAIRWTYTFTSLVSCLSVLVLQSRTSSSLPFFSIKNLSTLLNSIQILPPWWNPLYILQVKMNPYFLCFAWYNGNILVFTYHFKYLQPMRSWRAGHD